MTQVEVTRQGLRDIRTRYAETTHGFARREYYWLGFPPSAVQTRGRHRPARHLEGRISVTPLHIDLTHMPTVHDLKTMLGGSLPRADRDGGD